MFKRSMFTEILTVVHIVSRIRGAMFYSFDPK